MGTAMSSTGSSSGCVLIEPVAVEAVFDRLVAVIRAELATNAAFRVALAEALDVPVVSVPEETPASGSSWFGSGWRP
jgi:hypothetical protein